MNNDKEKLIAKRDEWQAKLDKLNERIEATPDYPKPWPQDGNTCYIVLSDGRTSFVEYCNDYANRLSQGNVKRTHKEAEALIAYRAAYTKLANMVPRDWVCDWGNDKQEKWFCFYNYIKGEWKNTAGVVLLFTQLPHFPTKESLVTAIEAMGSDMDALKYGGCM